jgi:hypothetical protein
VSSSRRSVASTATSSGASTSGSRRSRSNSSAAEMAISVVLQTPGRPTGQEMPVTARVSSRENDIRRA